jgi:inhibitor of cysteine peptidase
MKKLFMVILAGVALLTIMLSGCTSSVKAFTESGQVINTGVNQEFIIALGSNITTGYSWQPDYDTNALNLVEQTYQEQDNTGKQIVGASGTEYFIFEALVKGETEVTFTYQRPWEQPSAQDQTMVFTINVK